MAYCDKVGGPVSRIFKAGIPKIGKGEQAIEKAIEDAGAREIGKMKRKLRPLAAVATISPLLGLLGTVYGMIEAFQAASNAGHGKSDMLAEGIYVALVTTAAGLSLAIPVLIVADAHESAPGRASGAGGNHEQRGQAVRAVSAVRAVLSGLALVALGSGVALVALLPICPIDPWGALGPFRPRDVDEVPAVALADLEAVVGLDVVQAAHGV